MKSNITSKKIFGVNNMTDGEKNTNWYYE